MEATKNQYELSQVLVRRGQEKFANRKDSEEKKETDRFFYWIMEQMGKEAENFDWECHAYEIALTTRYFDNRLKVHHRGKFHSDKHEVRTSLSKEQFCKIMKEVTDFINTLPNFTASYVKDDGFSNACMYVTMVIPEKQSI